MFITTLVLLFRLKKNICKLISYVQGHLELHTSVPPHFAQSFNSATCL